MISILLLVGFFAGASEVVSGGPGTAAALAGDLFSQDPGCTDYHQGCMRITWEQWRTPGQTQVCHDSCSNPCVFSGKDANANAKPANFDAAACEQQCMHRQPISQLLKPQSKNEPKCIVIHYSGEPAKNQSPVSKEQASYADAMVFDPGRGDKTQKSSGGKCQWGDTPYHYQIDNYGNLIEGRSPDFQPDTNTRGELNTDGKINIVVDGDYRTVAEQNGRCAAVNADRFSDKQLSILKKTVNFLKHKYNTNYVTAHMWLASTDCPGDDIMTKLEAAGVLTGCPGDHHNPHKNQPSSNVQCHP